MEFSYWKKVSVWLQVVSLFQEIRPNKQTFTMIRFESLVANHFRAAVAVTLASSQFWTIRHPKKAQAGEVLVLEAQRFGARCQHRPTRPSKGAQVLGRARTRGSKRIVGQTFECKYANIYLQIHKYISSDLLWRSSMHNMWDRDQYFLSNCYQ